MDKKNLLLILLFTIIIFIPFFVRPSFIGADPYYYLNKVCLDDHASFKSGVVEFVFGLLPCDFLFIKLVMFGLVFLTLLGLGLLVEHFFPKKSFLACFLVYGFSPILFKWFFKLENDLFALPLLVLAILFYFKTMKHKGTTKFFAYSIVSLILLFLSAQFTPFTLFFLYIGGVGNPLYFIFLIIGLIIEPRATAILPNLQVAEMMPLIGLASIFILFFAWIKPLHKKEMLIATILVLLQAKFLLFIPFIYAPSLINSFEWLKAKKKINPYTIFGIYAVIGVIAFGFLTLTYFPDQTTLNFSEQSVLLQKEYNIPLYNNWSYGYFVKHYGYPTKYYSSLPQPDYNNLDKPFLALTTFDLNCEVLQQEKNLKIYYCE